MSLSPFFKALTYIVRRDASELEEGELKEEETASEEAEEEKEEDPKDVSLVSSVWALASVWNRQCGGDSVLVPASMRWVAG